jgi:colanic acid/amylovoran biosynthesis protein
VRILVDSCAYNCQNVGDLAMLAVAVSRLESLFPASTIEVITNAPQLVRRHCGPVGTVPVHGRRLLLRESLLGPINRMLPEVVASRWRRAEARFRLKTPRIFERSLRLKARLAERDTSAATAFLSAINSADLLVVNGAGILTDAFLDHALGILATLELAIRRKIPTAMFGQGFGPINNTTLRQRAAEVLPRVSLIAAREALTSVPLLTSLGVREANIVVTGDDAVEMAFDEMPRRFADTGSTVPKIGVNVRVAPYAEIGSDIFGVLREVLEETANERGARLLPIPIAHHGGRMDVEALRDLLADTPDEDGWASLDTPQRVIARIGECRVMVTGSYHGAVFALAQGIPVVALAKSTYYTNKMLGLAHQFGLGCEVVRLNESHADLAGRLRAAINRAWIDVERVREPLLDGAVDQILRSRAAYTRLRDSIVQTSEHSLAHAHLAEQR